MKLFSKDLRSEVAIVAEIGVNHEGDPDAALRLMRLAAQSGADAVKFQFYSPERLACSDDAERLARVTRFALDPALLERFATEARELGVGFFSSAISEDMVPAIARSSPAIKIASGDLDFEPVIRAAAATGLPVLLSTGTGNIDEIDRAVGWVRDESGGASLADRILLFQCVSSYPTPIEEAQTAAIPYLSERYGVLTGFSNHVIGPEACYAAIALGASMIEVHFTDCKTGRPFRDHALSFEPEDLKDLAQKAPRIRAAVGRRAKDRQPSETGMIQLIRKGVVAARDIASGTVLTGDDLMYARPATEFPAGERATLIGRRLKADVRRGQIIQRQFV